MKNMHYDSQKLVPLYSACSLMGQYSAVRDWSFLSMGVGCICLTCFQYAQRDFLQTLFLLHYKNTKYYLPLEEVPILYPRYGTFLVSTIHYSLRYNNNIANMTWSDMQHIWQISLLVIKAGNLSLLKCHMRVVQGYPRLYSFPDVMGTTKKDLLHKQLVASQHSLPGWWRCIPFLHIWASIRWCHTLPLLCRTAMYH